MMLHNISPCIISPSINVKLNRKYLKENYLLAFACGFALIDKDKPYLSSRFYRMRGFDLFEGQNLLCLSPTLSLVRLPALNE